MKCIIIKNKSLFGLLEMCHMCIHFSECCCSNIYQSRIVSKILCRQLKSYFLFFSIWLLVVNVYQAMLFSGKINHYFYYLVIVLVLSFFYEELYFLLLLLLYTYLYIIKIYLQIFIISLDISTLERYRSIKLKENKK